MASEPLIKAVEELLDAVTFDDSGVHGRGGNGGLLSRETIQKAGFVRIELDRFKRGQPECIYEARAEDGSELTGAEGSGIAWCRTHGFNCPGVGR